jgi:hypothetical protein
MEDVMLTHIRAMLKFLGKDRIVVPHFALPLPERVAGHWRNTHLFWLVGYNGKLSYKGWNGPAPFKEIQIEGIEPTKLWLDRAYWACKNDVNMKARRMALTSTMENCREYIYRFHGLKWMID